MPQVGTEDRSDGPAVERLTAFTLFADVWPRTIETEIGAALCAIGRGKGL